MPSVRVSLLRRAPAVASLLLALGLTPAVALADTGGAVMPGGAQPAETTPAPLDAPGTLPGPDAATPDATQATLSAPVLPLPALRAVTRRPEDPATEDLAALSFPSPIAAVDGHIVIVRPHMGRSELVDVGDPRRQRVLLVSTRTFGTPLAGRDASGQPVVVVSPCAGTDEVVLESEVPRCPLRVIDLATAQSRALPSTTGALAGDMAGDRLVFTRPSPQLGVRLYEASGGGAARPAELPDLAKAGVGPAPAMGRPYRGSVRASAFDVDSSGRVAVVLNLRSKRPTASSALWLRAADGRWTRLVAVGTTFTGMGTREVLGPRLDPTGVSAYVEGVIESPSYAAHWTDGGAVSTKVSLRRSIGRSTILLGATYDGGRLLFVDWLPGAPCGAEGALACGLRAAGPLALS